MKIAIVTFTNELNYGAILQAYSLQKFLEKYSETDIINFRFELNNNSLSRKIIEFIKKKKFSYFKRRFLKMSSFPVNNYIDFKNSIEKYDLVFVGSDQVWALDIIKKYKDIFFLNNIDNVVKCSYAASFGKNENYINNKKEIKTYLKNFKSISLRESSSSDLLINDNIENETNVDPTLLLESNDYIKGLNLTKKNDKYVLVYMLLIDEKVIEIAKKVSEILGLNIYCFNNKNRFGKKGKCFPNASPKEFLEKIYNATFIITNSFHGTCFSIVFKKRFISVIHPTRGIRQKDMLIKFGLENRIYDDNKDINYYINEDLIISNKLTEEIKKSQNYLINNIEDIKK